MKLTPDDRDRRSWLRFLNTFLRYAAPGRAEGDLLAGRMVAFLRRREAKRAAAALEVQAMEIREVSALLLAWTAKIKATIPEDVA